MFFPLLQDNSHVQVLSLDLFCKVMELVVDKGKKALKSTVCKSLPPLFFHCHDENWRVAEVRTRGLQAHPWEGARLPPALVPGRLQPPPGLGTGTRVLCPGLWGHLCTSAALQASRETLQCAAKFLNSRNLMHLLKTENLWMFAECLVRTAWKPQAQPGEAPCPR